MYYDLGPDFFPAAIGLLDPDRHSVSTVVLGADWASQATFRDWCRRKQHVQGNTFRQTLAVLRKAHFDVADCFFTNAWPVMRAHTPDIGHHLMRDDGRFTNLCREYLRHTLKILKIRLVVSLGHASAWFLGPLL